MKVKRIVKFLCAVCALAAAACTAVAPAFAMPAIQKAPGTCVNDVYVLGGDQGLRVASKKITFDLKDLPQYGEAAEEYQSTVTTQYAFKNSTVEAKSFVMGVPVGEAPFYYGETTAPVITVDGNAVQTQTRHTLKPLNYDYASNAQTLGEGWYADEFYSADLPVNKCTVTSQISQSGVMLEKVYAGDYTKARYIDDELITSAQEKSVYYILGDSAQMSVTHTYFTRDEKGDKKVLDVPCTVVQEQTTLKELVLSFRETDSVVSEEDWFRAAVSSFNKEKIEATKLRNLQISEDDFAEWLTYALPLDAGATALNAVTMPVYPEVSGNYYSYDYGLSAFLAAEGTVSFEVELLTNFYADDFCVWYDRPASDPISGIAMQNIQFEKTETGYKHTSSRLPSGVLNFTVSESEDSYYYPNGGAETIVDLITTVLVAIITGVLVLSFIAGLTVLIVFLVKRNKKKK